MMVGVLVVAAALGTTAAVLRAQEPRAQDVKAEGAPARPYAVQATVDVRWEPTLTEVGEALDEARRQLSGGVGDLYETGGSYQNGVVSITVATSSRDRQEGVDAIRGFVKRLGDDMKARHETAMKEYAANLAVATKGMDEASDGVRAVDAELGALRNELRRVTRRVDVSREGISAAATGLEEEAQKVSIELRAREARKQMMERVVAEIVKRSKEEAKADPILAELEGIVGMRMRELELAQKMHQAATVSMSEVEAMRAKVAEAKIRLLERREQAAKGAGTDTVKGLNDSLLMMSIDIAEQQARLEAVRETLASFERATELLERVDQTMERRQEAAQALAERRAKAREVEMKMGSVRQPTISLRGLEAKPAEVKPMEVKKGY